MESGHMPNKPPPSKRRKVLSPVILRATFDNPEYDDFI